MENRSAPRKKKRISCELITAGDRYSGIVLDVSATGLFIQTSAKPDPGSDVEVKLALAGAGEPVVIGGRVARKKLVPAQLLSVAQGGIGISITRPTAAYLDFIAEMSPQHAESVAEVRAKGGAPAAPRGGDGAAHARSSGRGNRGGNRSGEPAVSRFRIHAVETTSGQKNTFLAACASEQEANDQVEKQLGDAWQVLFIERV